MTKQLLLERYQTIEQERKLLKEAWCKLKDNKGDKKEIENIGRKLTELTYNQAHILIDLERLKYETS